MARYTKGDRIEDLIVALNEKRKIQGKKPVKRGWTGLKHWLHTDEPNHTMIGAMYNDDEFIGFLQGMMVDQDQLIRNKSFGKTDEIEMFTRFLSSLEKIKKENYFLYYPPVAIKNKGLVTGAELFQWWKENGEPDMYMILKSQK